MIEIYFPENSHISWKMMEHFLFSMVPFQVTCVTYFLGSYPMLLRQPGIRNTLQFLEWTLRWIQIGVVSWLLIGPGTSLIHNGMTICTKEVGVWLASSFHVHLYLCNSLLFAPLIFLMLQQVCSSCMYFVCICMYLLFLVVKVVNIPTIYKMCFKIHPFQWWSPHFL